MMHIFSVCLYFFLSVSVYANVQQKTVETENLEKLVNEMLGQRLAAYDTKLADQELIIADLKDQINHGSQSTLPTLFLATISEWQLSVSDGEIIVWDTDRINPGGHYNPTIGAYTAPYDGYYQFTVTKTGDGNNAVFFLLVDGERYYDNDVNNAADIAPTASATINIELTAGQIVQVENSGAGLIIYGTDPNEGYIWSWFTGYMLYLI